MPRHQRLEPVDLDDRPVMPRLSFGHVGLGSLKGRLKWLGIDGEEQLPLLYQRAFAVVLGLQEAGHSGSDLDVFASTDLAGEFGLHRHVLYVDRLDDDLRRWGWRSRRLLPTGSQTHDNEQCRQRPTPRHDHKAPGLPGRAKMEGSQSSYCGARSTRQLDLGHIPEPRFR